jgi:cytochrome c biogenesis protein CcmG/thiol:disulfide interchange protein DsbE
MAVNKRVLGVGVVVVLPLVAVLVANLGRDPHAIATPLVGKQAPPFDLGTLDSGGKVSLRSLAGRPVVLNFWASWCVPCQAENPVLLEAARANPDVSFLGVVYEDEPARAAAFLRELGAGYPSLLDPQATTAVAYGVAGVPETYFIDRAGRIVGKYAAPLSDDVLARGMAMARSGS